MGGNLVKILYDYAMQFVGTPYRWGGDDPIDGYDCSGFVQELLSSVGHDPKGDQTAQALFDYFNAMGRAEWNVHKIGALAFFGKDPTHISHVAMLLDEYRMIEAGGGGSQTTNRAEAAAQNAYIRIRPISNRSDLVAVLRPRYHTIGQF